MSFGRFAGPPSPVPGWTTLRAEPSSSTAPSEEEGSPMPDDTPKSSRKRKNSPNTSTSQRKRPKAIHSATQPGPVSKLHSGLSLKAKGKERHRSLDRDSTSPDFDGTDMLFNQFSSQRVSSASASASTPQKEVMGSKQTSVSARKPKRIKTRATFAHALKSLQPLCREETPIVNGELIDISDDDVPPPRLPQRSLTQQRAISPSDIIVISSDDDASPGPSRAVSSGPSHSTATALRKFPTNRQHSQVYIKPEDYIVVSDSDEEVVNSPSASAAVPPESPLDIHPPELLLRPNMDLGGDDESPRLQQSPLPSHLSPYANVDADFDFGRPSSVLADSGSGIQYSSIPRAESPDSFSPGKVSEPVFSEVAESPSKTVKSPSPIDAESAAPHEPEISSSPPQLDETLSLSPTAPAPPSPILADLPAPADIPTVPSPTFLPPSRNSPRTSPAIHEAAPAKLRAASETKLSPSPPLALHSIRLPLISHIRIEPSVPPLPAANAYDWGPRHHGSGGLFKNVLARSSRSFSTPTSNRVPSNELQILKITPTSAEGDIAQPVRKELTSAPLIYSKDEIKAPAANDGLITTQPSLNVLRSPKEEVCLPTTSYRGALALSETVELHNGKTLRDVINQAYKMPYPDIIDLTLEDDNNDIGPSTTISASILETARALDEFLASDNEETTSDSDTQPDVILPTSSTYAEQSDDLPVAHFQHSHGEMVGSNGPVAKTGTSLDAIRSVLHKRHALANVGKMTAGRQSIPLRCTPSIGDISITTEASLAPASIVLGPTVGEASVGGVEALMVTRGNEDIKMKYEPPYTEPPTSIAEPDQDIPSEQNFSVPPANDDFSEDEMDGIQSYHYGKRLRICGRQSSMSEIEDNLCDLAYPDSDPAVPSLAKSSPLKHEITRRSSSLPLSPPLSARTSSRRSSRSARSSDDPMDLLDDNIESNDANNITVYEAGSGSGASNDHSPSGSPYITWHTVRRATQERPPHFLKAKDLPHTLQDWLNAFPPMYRATDQARIIFEAAIRESTAADEPGAPPIKIYNDIDDEVTPPWEFHYTNLMWYGDGVPAPDLKTLQGCDCEGRCDPKSKTCLCVLKQSKYLERTGFVYNDKGRLIEPLHYPIFECNDFCGCGEECQNRVVQAGRKCSVNIVKTKDKGWGVFADSKKIPAGTFVGIYAGELLRDSVGEERGMKYNAFGKTYLFDIDLYYLKDEDPDWQVSYTVDAYHAGNFTRFLNHSCEPNCMITHCYINEGDKEKPLLTVFTQEDVEPWGELCFSYNGTTYDDVVEAIDTTQSGNGAVYEQCRCRTPSCKGVMFK